MTGPVGGNSGTKLSQTVIVDFLLAQFVCQNGLFEILRQKIKITIFSIPITLLRKLPCEALA
jgi:hypothetical protein